MGISTNANYEVANRQLQKEPVIVFKIDGIDTLFSSTTIYKTLNYDDTGITYDSGYVYDQLVAVDNVKTLIDRKGSFASISQKLEQWDGRASIGTFNIRMIDYRQLMTQICTPGLLLEEILNRKVSIYFGYTTISFPQDYLLLFRGYVNNLTLEQGAVKFDFTDPSSKRKTSLFSATDTTLTTPIIISDTTLTVGSTSKFYQTILNAKGIADDTITIGLVIDDKEIVTYTNADIISGTQINVVRGQFGTLAQNFDADSKVTNFIYFVDNAINIALKVQLSGWNDSWKKNIPLRSIVNDDNGNNIPDSITFAVGVDVVRDFGFSIGDFITLSDSPESPNNAVFTVADFFNENRSIKVLETGILVQENPGAGNLDTIAAIRSKYDVYPLDAGLGLTTDDVFVTQHEMVRDVFVQNTYKMAVKGVEASGKEWIEKHLYKPVGAYSLTQGARISVGSTHPPLVDDLTKILDHRNIIDAKGITVSRGLNSRFFYNEILFQYSYNPLDGTLQRTLIVDDSESINRMEGLISTLVIECRGFDDSDNSRREMTARANRLLQRYRFGAEIIKVKSFFGVGHTLDAGDVVVLTDATPSVLQISNTVTGTRGVYDRIMEVQERQIGLSSGIVDLTLLANNGFNISDRYGVVGPSDYIDETYVNTTTKIKYKDSFFTSTPTAEYKKWIPYQGSKIRVHNIDYSDDAETFFTLDLVDQYVMHLDPPLPFTPGDGYVIEFSEYDDSSVDINSLVKASFPALDPLGLIDSASSETVFTLQTGYAAKFQIGEVVYVASPDFVNFSPDVKITNIVGDVVTIGPIFSTGGNDNLGYIPSNGDLLMLGGFTDGGQGYRYI